MSESNFVFSIASEERLQVPIYRIAVSGNVWRKPLSSELLCSRYENLIVGTVRDYDQILLDAAW